MKSIGLLLLLIIAIIAVPVLSAMVGYGLTWLVVFLMPPIADILVTGLNLLGAGDVTIENLPYVGAVLSYAAMFIGIPRLLD